MGCGLRRETEDMLKLMPIDCKLVMHKSSKGFKYFVEKTREWDYPIAVGSGMTKAQALGDLLKCWRMFSGQGGFAACPAQSREELRIKIDLLRDDGTR